MLFGQDRDELRRMYLEAWRKARHNELLSPLERQIAAVVEDHPEYRKFLSDDAVEQDFRPEDGKTNPFLHMSLHLALRDQVKTDRPPGIRAVYQRLAARRAREHDAEHDLIECLAEALWEAQNRRQEPDVERYLERARALVS